MTPLRDTPLNGSPTNDARSSAARSLARFNIGVAGLVLGLKVGAHALTGSVALLSDALESGVNLFTALAALVALQVAKRPADRTHQFGHHKAEYIAAVVEGALILAAAIVILQNAAVAFWSPRMPIFGLGALALTGVATVINALWAVQLIRRGRQLASPALTADGWHLVTDVVTSIGVVIGLSLAVMTGAVWLDPLLAALTAVFVLWAGLQLLRQSFSGLMDEAVTSEVRRQMRAIIAENAHGAIEAHDIKSRVAGQATFIVFHLVVPGTMTVKASHVICDRLEAALEASIAGAIVTIHVEPEAERKANGDALKV